MGNVRKCLAGLIALAVAALMMVPATSYAENVTVDVTPNAATANPGVSDYPTDIEISKLASDTHDPVRDAHMQVIDKATGKVMDDWWTSDRGHRITKVLNVGTEYVLHEEKAPDGYAVMPDVTFTIGATDGDITLVSDGSGHSELADKTHLNAYDDRMPREIEIERTESRGKTFNGRHEERGKTRTGHGDFPQMGDTTSYAAMAGAAVAGVAAIAAGIVSRKRRDRE